MNDFYIIRKGTELISYSDNGSCLSLLMKREPMEIMRQTIIKGATCWITPTETCKGTEFFYLISGLIEVVLPVGTQKIYPGDSFYLTDIDHDYRLIILEESELLYVSDTLIFDGINNFNNDLYNTLSLINSKDNVTLIHSRNVLRFSMELYGTLFPKQHGTEFNDMVTAALFHDAGKCSVPDEILKKTGKLTAEEFTEMKKHPAETYRMLRERFGESVALIGGAHHERLDGSGYPGGLRGNEIPIGARIIAVADAFDAMTSERPYQHKVKRPLDAAEELLSLPHHYDSEVSALLLKLVKENKLNTTTYPNDFYKKIFREQNEMDAR